MGTQSSAGVSLRATDLTRQLNAKSVAHTFSTEGRPFDPDRPHQIFQNPEYSPRYLAYCRVHRLLPGTHQRIVDELRWGHRNLGLLFWDGFHKIVNRVPARGTRHSTMLVHGGTPSFMYGTQECSEDLIPF